MMATFETRAEREAHARKLREHGMLLREIAAEMGVKRSTVHAWLSDPGGLQMKARKDSYRGVCDTCGGPTDGSNGAANAPSRCMDCRTWTRDAVLEALREWGDDHGGIPPRLIDTRPGYEGHGRLPTDTTVGRLFGGWNAALLAARYSLHMDRRPETTEAMAEMIRSGMTADEVGERFGVTGNAVSYRLRYHGTPISELRKTA
jgi:predicted transcriptional regulator